MHLKHAQELLTKQVKFTPYSIGQKVWLEGSHLKTSQPTTKLHAKRYGPFIITHMVSYTTYQLDLPS